MQTLSPKGAYLGGGAWMSLATWAGTSTSMCVRPLAVWDRPGWARGLWESVPKPPHFSAVPNRPKNTEFKSGLPGCYEKYIICQGGSTAHTLLGAKT